ncbi:hypothetical protein [Mucilaginibacter paludis]|uniref:Uncharacterized protein n=1 Tax=Mucilaginibacter paludis DSM 18603 TaxID=714943 RepID=H1Y3K5_9SPHI|nr:hypothetical protein [Mucilaginibacter paludis]EHQ29773.1 hypothetical protein Mucpa_5704 [Mucilaginibacter paludis DSM 18603]
MEAVGATLESLTCGNGYPLINLGSASALLPISWNFFWGGVNEACDQIWDRGIGTGNKALAARPEKLLNERAK